MTKKSGAVTLKAVAKRVGLAAGTVSNILNHSPHSCQIPQRTKDRVFAAARTLNYHPNPLARALRIRPVPDTNQEATNLGGMPGALMFKQPEHLMRAIHAIRRAGLCVPGDAFVVDIGSLPSGLVLLTNNCETIAGGKTISEDGSMTLTLEQDE
jgi:hypothetical protein